MIVENCEKHYPKLLLLWNLAQWTQNMVQANNFTFNYDTKHLGTTWKGFVDYIHYFYINLYPLQTIANMHLSGLNSRQNTVLLVIIVLCIIICIGLYFLSVSNDFHELQSFYYSFLERKSLICEGRMAHRQDLERMASKLVSCDIERLHCCYCFKLTHQIFEGCWNRSSAG